MKNKNRIIKELLNLAVYGLHSPGSGCCECPLIEKCEIIDPIDCFDKTNECKKKLMNYAKKKKEKGDV